MKKIKKAEGRPRGAMRTLHFRCPQQLLEQLRRGAELAGIRRSDYVRSILLAACARNRRLDE